ncbi:DUF456 domain-containing protein [soil metagenome]|nr:DUF456 domain-containing protein [Trueperaceae bacterium]
MVVLASLVLMLGLGVAVVGVIVPALPAVPFALLGAVLAAWMTGFERIDVSLLVWVAVLTALAQGVDLLGTWFGSRYFGARRAGLWGGIVGALVGIVIAPPWGFLAGALGGAFLAELATGRPTREAFEAGVGALVGTLTGVAGKFVIIVVIAFITLGRLWRG